MGRKVDVLVFGLLSFCVFFLMSQTVQAEGTPFVCNETNFVSLGESGRAGLYVVDYSTNPYGLDVIDEPELFDYNAIGFNIKNGEIYAVVRSSGGGFVAGEIISIDAAENITNYGASTPTTNSFSGDVDENGLYYTFNGTALIVFDTQDVLFPANGTMYTLDTAFGADAVYNPTDGLLYSVSGGDLLTLDPADLTTTTAVTVTAVPITTVGSTVNLNSAGAMWADAFGRLFAYKNSGQIYEVTTAGVATFVSSAPDVGGNDGTGCAYAPIIEKSVDPAVSEPGDAITYQIVMANGFRSTDLDLNFVDQLPAGFRWISSTYTITGNVVNSGTLNSYGGTDTVTVTGMTIGAGGVVTVTIEAISAAQILAGTYNNQAMMDSILPSLGGEKASDWPDGSDKGEPTPHEIVEVVEINLDKEMMGYVDVDEDVLVSRGDVLTYSFTATNGSNTALNGVTVTDALPGLSGLDCSPQIPADNVLPDDSITCTAVYTVTQQDVDEGVIVNTATVTGTSPLSITVSETVSESVPIIWRPEIVLVKMVTPTTGLLLGDRVTYTFVTTNTGNVTLDEVMITDTHIGLSPLACDLTVPADDFAPNDRLTCTATYTVTQDDVDMGEILNTATVSGHDPDGRQETNEASVLAMPLQMPSVELVKTAVPTSGWQMGDTITYTIVATNTGNVTLDEVTITDSLIDGLQCDRGIPFDDFSLNEVVICTATYMVTQLDVDAGIITNTATVTTVSPFGPSDSSAPTTISDEDDAVVVTDRLPEIVLRKTAVPTANIAVDDTITYSLVATNTGNTTLISVTITDSLLGLICPPVSLLPNDAVSCTATYTVTQDDMDAGVITNTAAVTSHAPDGSVPSDSDSAVVTAERNPAITLSKTAVPTANIAVDDTITYSLVATNTGNTTLISVTITDSLLGLICPPVSLLPNDAVSCTATYTVTQDDMDAGVITNTAAVTSHAPDGHTPSDSDSAVVTAERNPAIMLSKTAAPTAGLLLSETITYTLTAINVGNTTLISVTIADSSVDLICPPVSLLPNDVVSCTAMYTVMQQDVDVGVSTNTATVTSSAPDGMFPADVVSMTVTAVQEPSIELDKIAFSRAPFLAVGDMISYTITATNTGNVTLDPVVISDTLAGLSPFTCTDALAPQEMTTCTVTYTVTLTDVNNGVVSNSATVRGDAPNGDVVDAADSIETPIIQLPQLTLDKQFVGDGSAVVPLTVGDVLTYSIITTNTGNVTLDNVVVSDPLIGALNCTLPMSATLRPDDTISCTGSYTVQPSDVMVGIIENIATATGDTPDGTVVSDSDGEVVPPDTTANIEVEKVLAFHDDVDGNTILSAGDGLGYVITATNNGFVPLYDVVVTDTIMPTIACTPSAPAVLQPQETMRCTGVYTIVLTDTNSGEIVNVATASGQPTVGDTMTDSDTVIVPQPQVAQLLFNKAAVPSPSGFALGDTIAYRFFVINIGNVTLNDVTITDTLPGLSGLSCDQPIPADDFSPGETLICAATYQVTLEDADEGVVLNEAAAISTAPNGDQVEDEDDEAVPIVQTTAIVVDKTSDSTAPFLAVGDHITYTITATNTGGVTLNSLIFSDTLAGLSAFDCSADLVTATIVPQEAVTCTATYTVTLADVNNGSVINTVAVTADDPNGDSAQGGDSEETPITQSPALTVDKRLSGRSSADNEPDNELTIGEILTYTIITTNTGNVTITDVVVIDSLIDVLDCSMDNPAVLAPTEQLICTGSYTVLVPDVNLGLVVNSATAMGNAPDGTAVSDDDIENAPSETTAAIELEKIVASFDDIDQSHGLSVGDLLHYVIVVENRGVVPLSNVVISDTIISDLSCTPSISVTTTMQPNDTIMCTGSYTITQADIDAGDLSNTATVTATTPDGDDIGDTDSEIVPQPQRPQLTLTKAVTPINLFVDNVITYTLIATNTGNVTLDNVVISDTLQGLGGLICDRAVPADDFAPNETVACTAAYTVTQTDIDNGGLTNIATVTGVDPNGGEVSDADDAVLEAVQNPAIVFNKALLPLASPIALDDILTYRFFVINIGNVTLDNVMISDTLPGLSGVTCDQPLPADDFAPAEILICTTTYTVTQTDIDNGELSNSATVFSRDPNDEPVDGEDDEQVEIEQRPSLIVDKSAESNSPLLDPGNIISYTIVATNTGNVTLDNVVISDTLAGLSAFDCSAALPATLLPNQTLQCGATYTVTFDDVDNGSVFNTVTATGDAPNDVQVSDTDSTDTSIVQSPQLTADKFVAHDSTMLTAGDTLTYTIITTNTGNVTINNVEVFDPLLDEIVCSPALPTTLLPNESTLCRGQYTITQPDVNLGNIANTATATGNAPDGTVVDDSDNEDATLDTTANLETEKSLAFHDDVDGDENLSIGDRLEYVITAENSGRVTLSNIIITDTIIPDVVCDLAVPILLDPNEMITCTAIYTISQSDIDAAEIINSAIVTATTPRGDEVQDIDTEILPQPQLPDLMLNKVIIAKPADLIVGDVITYTLIATNTGNLTLNGVVISDTLLGVSQLMCDRPMPVDQFAPNDALTCTASYTVIQSDVDNGTIMNTGTVSGIAPDGTALSVTDTERVRGNRIAELALDKSSTIPPNADIGDVVTYTLIVTNVGSVTLNNVAITDQLSGLSALRCDRTLPINRLLPNEVVTCTATYTLRLFDFTLGTITNRGTAAGTSSSGTYVEVYSENTLALVRPQPTPTPTPQPTNTPSQPINTPLPTPQPTNTPTPLPTSTSTSTSTPQPTNTPLPTPIATPEPTVTSLPTNSPLPIPTISSTAVPQPAVTLDQIGLFDPNGDTLTGTLTLDFGVINYTFIITNSGNVPLTNVRINDPNITIMGDTINLDVDEVGIFSGRYVLTPADYAAGFVAENAIVVGEWQGGNITSDDVLPANSSDAPITLLPFGLLEGNVWHDLDVSRDGVQTRHDMPFAFVRVELRYADGSFAGEAVTDAAGNYRFENLLLNETYIVVVDSSTLPPEKSNMFATYEIETTLTFDRPIIRQINFAYVSADFGDLPDSYRTSGNDSPSHAVTSISDQFFLGNTISYEEDGQPTTMADGDHDDGISIIGDESFVGGETKLIKVKVSGNIPPEGLDLGIWLDWEHDNKFSSEEFISYRLPGGLPNGTVTLPSVPNIPNIPITAPDDYENDILSARFRLFSVGGAPGGALDWTDFAGHAVNGEVEDYIFAGATAVTIQMTSETTSATSTAWQLAIVVFVLSIGSMTFYMRMESNKFVE